MSGPLLDRVDIHVEVPPVQYRHLAAEGHGESSEVIRTRVIRAREIQLGRFANERFFTNSRMANRHIERYCPLDQDGQALLRQAMDALGLSARAYNKVLKVARTIADLEGSDRVSVPHISEAINYRSLDRTLE